MLQRAISKISNKFTRRLAAFLLILGLIFGLFPLGPDNQSNSHSKSQIYSPKQPDNSDKINQERVRAMAKHVWSGYKKYAWGDDEIHPVSKTGKNWTDVSYLFTPIDSLDTLFIMGLEREYKEAKDLVLAKLDIDLSNSKSHNHFELVIRVLGGLLSAFELDPDARYLELAVKVADRLLVAFDSSSGLPPQYILFQTGKGVGQQACMASVGTLQLEFQFLSDLTGNPIYQEKALAVYDILRKMNAKDPIPGLYHDSLSISNPPIFTETQKYGIGGNIDSFYEYLLKMYISTNEESFGRMYDISLNAILSNLVQTRNKTVFITNLVNNVLENEVEHLACFAGGMVSLGTTARKTDRHASRHFEIGQKFTETCMKSYDQSENGLGGESFLVLKTGETQVSSHNVILRPEVIESVFYHWRFTKKQHFRDFGVRMLDNLDKFAKTEAGYSSLFHDLKLDGMESFFMAETLKYLYLLFSDDSVIPLDQYVFNTEAHPFSIRGHGRRKDPSKWVKIKIQGL